jgi:hypothetical protein
MPIPFLQSKGMVNDLSSDTVKVSLSAGTLTSQGVLGMARSMCGMKNHE